MTCQFESCVDITKGQVWGHTKLTSAWVSADLLRRLEAIRIRHVDCSQGGVKAAASRVFGFAAGGEM